jgi:hypothetical protein
MFSSHTIMRYLALGLFIVALSHATLVSAQPVVDFRSIATSNDGRHYTVESSKLSELAHSRIVLTNFPIGYEEISTVILQPRHSPIDSRTAVFLEEKRIPTPASQSLVGSIAGESESRVVLVLVNNLVFGSIERTGRSPMMFSPDKHDPARSILISQADLFAMDSNPNFRCLNEDMQELDRLGARSVAPVSQRATPVSTRTLLETEIAVEADSCFFSAAGGTVDLASGYVAALFAMSSAIYEDEAQVTFHIPWLKLWASKDPYNVHGNAYALPDTVRSYWKTHYADVNRDVAHVMTSIGYGGGGFGWFSMCSTDYGYSVSSPKTRQSLPTFAFTYDAYIVSHELGHNFGLPHSHSCYWAPPLDTCYTSDDSVLKLSDACYGLPVTPRKSPGTIMSYCANANFQLSGNNLNEYKLNMTFSKRVADTLRRNAETYLCLGEPAEPTILLLNPRGGVTLAGDSTITIQWTSAHISTVDVSYRANESSAWSVIGDNIPATDGRVQWKLPNTATEKGMLEIHDASNPSVADTSLLPITILERAYVPETVDATAPQINYQEITFSREDAGSAYEIFDILGRTVSSGRIVSGTPIRLADLHGAFILRILNTERARSYRFEH